MTAETIITLLLQTLAAGGGAYAAVRVELRYLSEGVKEAKAAAGRAHKRIDDVMGYQRD